MVEGAEEVLRLDVPRPFIPCILLPILIIPAVSGWTSEEDVFDVHASPTMVDAAAAFSVVAMAFVGAGAVCRRAIICCWRLAIVISEFRVEGDGAAAPFVGWVFPSCSA